MSAVEARVSAGGDRVRVMDSMPEKRMVRHGFATLRDLVPSAAIVLPPSIPVRQALGMMKDAQMTAAPVLSRGTPVGVVSTAGIVAWLTRVGARVDGSEGDNHTVEEVMTRRIVVLPPHADWETAERTMRELAVEHVIVMDGRGCLGLISAD